MGTKRKQIFKGKKPIVVAEIGNNHEGNFNKARKMLELAIESGAHECITKDEFHEIQCSVNEIYNVKKKLEKKINNFISTKIEWIPLNSFKASKDQQENLIEFFETLEEDDDVQNIFSNVKLNIN